MKMLAENFKGIEFIRISNLPEDQKKAIKALIPRDKIIKIMKDKVIMHDCVQYHDYQTWYNQYKLQQLPQQHPEALNTTPSTYRLAFK